MAFVALCLIGFGIAVIAAPQIIAYVIGVILIFAGVNLLVLSGAIRRAPKKSDESVFRFGEYEIHRNRK